MQSTFTSIFLLYLWMSIIVVSLSSFHQKREGTSVAHPTSPYLLARLEQETYDGTNPAGFTLGDKCTTHTTPAGYYTKVEVQKAATKHNDFIPLTWSLCMQSTRECSDDIKGPSLSLSKDPRPRTFVVCMRPTHPAVMATYDIRMLILVPENGLLQSVTSEQGQESLQLVAVTDGNVMFKAWTTDLTGASFPVKQFTIRNTDDMEDKVSQDSTSRLERSVYSENSLQEAYVLLDAGADAIILYLQVAPLT